MPKRLTDEQREARRKERAEYMRQFAIQNRERINAQRRERMKSPERKAAKSAADKRYYEKAKPVVRQRQAVYRALNKERIAKIDAAWYMANKERRAEYLRAWVKRNSSAKTAYAQKRRAAKQRSSGRLSKDIVSRLLILQRGCCANCRVSFKKVKFHLDHKVALSKGGSNTDDNVQLLCAPCNLRKKAKDPITWAQENGRLL